MDLLSEEFLQILSGFNSYPLYGLPFMPNDNPFLTLPFHHNHRTNSDDVFFLKEFFRFNFHGIRNFLFVLLQYFLTNGFIHKKTFGLVG